MPVRLTVWGDPGALSVIVTAPERAPATVGVKVTVIVHERPAPRLAGQLVDFAKSPDIPIFVMDNGPVPVLVRVVDCDALVVFRF